MTPVNNNNNNNTSNSDDENDAGKLSEQLRLRYLPPPVSLAPVQSPHVSHTAHPPRDRYSEMLRSGSMLGFGLYQDRPVQRQVPSQGQITFEPLFVSDSPGGYRRDHYIIGHASTSASDEISQSVFSGGVAQHSPPWTIHDHGSFGPGSRPGGQPMTPAPTGFVEPRPINLNIPSSPMQLGFIPDDPKPSSSVIPALAFSQHNDSHSPSRSPPRGLGLGHNTAPTVLNPLQQVDGTEEDDGNGSSPVSSSQGTTAASNSSSSSDTTRPQQPGILETQTRFESVTAHTAKCDLCNSRNDAGMSRCLSCGWQSCHGCTLKNGCTRTHKAGSRVHTGPIDSSQLIPTGESSRGKKKGQGRGRGKSRSRAVHQSRLRLRDDNDNASPKRFARQEGVNVRTKQSHAHTRDDDRNIDASSSTATVRASGNTLYSPPSPLLASSSPINRQPSSPTTADDPGEARENMLEGARNLFAFSFEAYMTWTHEQGAKNRDQQEETSRAEEWEPFVDVEDFHLYAQKEATRVFEEYRWQN